MYFFGWDKSFVRTELDAIGFEKSPKATPRMHAKPAIRNDVQGLRAVAIFAVFLFHFFPEFFPNGYLGVDIFFVISGYLIYSILSRSIDKYSFSLSTIGDFYDKRLTRILPLSSLYIVGAAILIIILCTTDTIIEARDSAIKALFFCTNIFAILEQNDYFERIEDENLFTHTWSLSVEMQFYLLVPLLFGFRRLLHNTPLLFPVIAVASLGLYIYLPDVVSFNLPITRLWQFFAVTFCEAKVLGSNGTVPPASNGYARLACEENTQEKEDVEKGDGDPDADIDVEVVFSGAFTSLIYYGSLFFLLVPYLGPVVPPTIGRIAVTAATAALIVLGGDLQSRILTNVVAKFIGDVSYSLYLIHWPFAVYLVRGYAPLSLVRLSTIPLSLFVTFIVYECYEKHYRKWSKRTTHTVIVVLTGVALLLIAIAPASNNGFTQYMEPAQENIGLAEAMRQNHLAFYVLDKLPPRPNVTYESLGGLGPPQGIGRWPNGTGKLSFVLLGSSYAEDQATLIYDAFKTQFSTFTVATQWACEVFGWTRKVNRYCAQKFNYIDAATKLRPDVMFIIQRYYRAKEPLPKEGAPDPIYDTMKGLLMPIANTTHLALIEDALPATNKKAIYDLNNYLKKGASVEEINNITIIPDDGPARVRLRKLMGECSNCRLYDLAEAFYDDKGKFTEIDAKTSLAILNHVTHLTPYAKTRAAKYYKSLASKYAKELKALTRKLYPKR